MQASSEAGYDLFAEFYDTWHDSRPQNSKTRCVEMLARMAVLPLNWRSVQAGSRCRLRQLVCACQASIAQPRCLSGFMQRRVPSV